MSSGIIRLRPLLVVAAALLHLVSVNAFANTVQDVRLWHSPDKTRLVFDLSGSAKHSLFMLDNPSRLVIDISDTNRPKSTKMPKLEKTPIGKIRYGMRNQNDLRVVLDLKKSVKSNSFLLQPNGTYGHRLVVDLMDNQSSRLSARDPAELRNPDRPIIVAIDAGHGGEDPGALAYGGGHEKTVTLNIARDLEALFKKEKLFKPVMIRTGDYYISLRERTRLARKAGADLFVSIHADAFTDRRARGASVYALSRGGATSETARWLAQKDNSSDQIGGEGGISLSDKDDILAGVLLDLSMTSTLASSLQAGDHVLKNIGRINRLHKRKVEQAAFVVLKSPDIPSILVETGFISNPAEGKKLKTRSHQRAMAHQIHQGIRGYFVERPPTGTLLARLKQENKLAPNKNSYVVRAGDTLSEIALQFNVSTGVLKSLNNIAQSDQLRIGQVLSIPGV